MIQIHVAECIINSKNNKAYMRSKLNNINSEKTYKIRVHIQKQIDKINKLLNSLIISYNEQVQARRQFEYDTNNK